MSDPAAQSLLAAELSQALGISLELLPCEPEPLRQSLCNRGPGFLLLDLSLVPAVLPVLSRGSIKVIGVTTLRQDPRAAKLAQWGAPTLHLSQVPGYLAQSLQAIPGPGPAAGAAPSPAAFIQSVPGPALAMPAVPAAAPSVLPGPESAGAPVIVVHSPKGGAGTSTVAAHLATCWARQGMQVLLIDLSAYGAAAVLCKARQQGMGLEALASTVEMAPDCLAPGFDLAPYLTPLPVTPGRLDLLAGARPHLLDRFTPQQVMALLSLCTQLPYDAVVVDSASEPTVRTLAALETADWLILVATADYTACWNLVNLQDLLQTLRVKAERLLVLNRFTGGGLSPDELQQRLGIPLVAVLPEHPLLRDIGNRGRPWDLQPHDPFTDAVAQLATALRTSPAVSLYG